MIRQLLYPLLSQHPTALRGIFVYRGLSQVVLYHMTGSLPAVRYLGHGLNFGLSNLEFGHGQELKFDSKSPIFECFQILVVGISLPT